MKQLNTHVFLLCILICCSSSLFAQRYSGVQANKIYQGASQVNINPLRHSISFIRLDAQTTISSATAENWLRSDVLKLRKDDGIVQYQQINDKIGFTHVRYHQSYKGIPVEYGTYYIHNKDGRVVSANGEWYSGVNISTKPSISAKQAT
jgi:Zn-dependent metalloprotease